MSSPLWLGLFLSPDNKVIAIGNAIIHGSFWLIVFAFFTQHPIEEWVIAIALIYAVWLIAIRAMIFMGAFSGRRLMKRIEVTLEDVEAILSRLETHRWVVARLTLTTLLALTCPVLFASGVALVTADAALVELKFLALPKRMVSFGAVLAISGLLVFSSLTSLSWLSVIRWQRMRALGISRLPPTAFVFLVMSTPAVGSRLVRRRAGHDWRVTV